MYQIPLNNDLVIDNFAGGGGASCGIERGLGRPVNVAINHDRVAIGMHEANHPGALHLCEDVWDVNPREVVKGRSVGLAWFSPDCKHFSKAKGSKPVEKKIRGLAWVAIRWAATVRPKVIILENVEEFVTWGPCDEHGYPIPHLKGITFKSFVKELRRLGYEVEWKELRACDYGAGTIRKRLFMVARCDGRPIVWPAPTHGPGLIPYVTAADCIDWSIPCPSIFTPGRDLAEATMARIARGLKRYVLDNPKPFIVRTNHGESGGRRDFSIDEPFMTITQKFSDGLVVPILAGVGGRAAQSRERAGNEPMGTTTSKADTALCAAFLAKHFGGMTGVGVDTPMPTQTAAGTQTQLVSAYCTKFYGTATGSAMDEPLHSITAQGGKHAQVQAFMIKYYGTNQDPRLEEPLHTITTKDRFGLVMVHGEPWQIVDIGMRMFTPRELYTAQGFPKTYKIDAMADGTPLSKTAQVRMCGNSVSPVLAEALSAANDPSLVIAPSSRARFA